MHHSGLCAVLIDCKTADVDEAARFWAAAPGRPVDLDHPSRDNYRMLATPTDEPIVEIQRVALGQLHQLLDRAMGVSRASVGCAIAFSCTVVSIATRSRSLVRDWKIDRARYLATPIMSDGREGPPLELRGLFEQFLLEAG